MFRIRNTRRCPMDHVLFLIRNSRRLRVKNKFNANPTHTTALDAIIAIIYWKGIAASYRIFLGESHGVGGACSCYVARVTHGGPHLYLHSLGGVHVFATVNCKVSRSFPLIYGLLFLMEVA